MPTVSQPLPLFSSINCSNNILMPQVTVDMIQNKNDIEVFQDGPQGIFVKFCLNCVHPTIFGDNLQIHGVQITGKCSVISLSNIYMPTKQNFLLGSYHQLQNNGRLFITPRHCFSENILPSQVEGAEDPMKKSISFYYYQRCIQNSVRHAGQSFLRKFLTTLSHYQLLQNSTLKIQQDYIFASEVVGNGFTLNN